MKIINNTRNTILADKAEVADTVFKRIKGLLGKDGLGEKEALIIKSCDSVHTFFMRFPIDVVFLNKHNRVMAAIPHLKPFRITPVYFTAQSVVELPAGTIGSTRTENNDSIEII